MKAFLIAILVVSISNAGLAAENTLTISGELNSKPCSVKPGDEVINIKLDTATDSQLFKPGGRTKIKLFPIHLEKCNPSVAKTLRITMNGTPSSYDNTFLALAPESTAQGLGIKFTTNGAAEIPLGGSIAFPVSQGSMTAELGAYMKMLSKDNFKVGVYKATANLTLSFE